MMAHGTESSASQSCGKESRTLQLFIDKSPPHGDRARGGFARKDPSRGVKPSAYRSRGVAVQNSARVGTRPSVCGKCHGIMGGMGC